MGMINYNPLKNAASTLKSLFKNATPQTPQQMTGSLPGMQQGIPGYANNPYQIQQGDTFETIASKNNTTAAALQAANNGMAVPPPKGSFIDIPMPSLPGVTPVIQPPSSNPYQIAPSNYNVDMRGRDYNPYGYNVSQRGRGYNASTQQLTYADELQSQFASGSNPPPSVPATMLSQLINPNTGIAMTPDDMLAGGYVLDHKTGAWNLAAAAGGTATGTPGKGDFYGYQYNPATGRSEQVIMNAATGGNFLNQKRWDPSTKKFVSIGRLIRQGKLDLQGHTHKGKPRNNTVAVTPTQATNSGGTPGTVLDLHLGSG